MTDLIVTERLVLRRFQPADADAVVTLINDLDVARWLTKVPHPYSRTDAEQFIARHALTADRCFAVTRDEDLIGCMSIVGQLGYWFGQPYWGQGYATESARAVVADYFASTDEDLTSGYLDGSAGSRNVLTKLGFVPAGKEQATPVSLGTVVTLHKMVLTAESWRARG